MTEIVNLSRVREQRARAGRAVEAAANRAKHGRTAAEKAADGREEARRRALLDGARLPAARDEPPG